ncbi:MAG: GNAT family N-acetyltransferase [Candidatus Zixiibacteriota bacterium]
MDVTIVRTDSGNTDFRGLVVLLDQDLKIRDGDEHAFYATYNKIDYLKQVVVAYLNGVAVGCGAIKEFSSGVGEIKRMFVLPEYRGKGIAGKVLGELEKWGAEMGYSSCVLETGKKQPEAIRLYTKSGYSIIPNYGQYQGMENSVCMEKRLETTRV